MRFRVIEEHIGTLPTSRLCQIMEVSARGYRAYKSRPISQRQRNDMVLLAHNCYDNAAVETFFKTIKAELIWRHLWQTRRQAEVAIFEYINGFYNPRRKHSALGWKSPLAFEKEAA